MEPSLPPSTELLTTQSFGTGDVPVLIVHGLFGSARNWGVIAKRLGETRRVLTVDMRYHGTSVRASSQTYADMAGDLARVIDSAGGMADVIGHSMGGKAAMMLALTRPALLRRLVVADIAPVAYSHSQSHLIDAMEALDLAAISTRSEADAALARHVDDPGVRAFLLQSLAVRDKTWLLNLSALRGDMGAIIGWPDPAGQFDGPTLFLTGAESDYVRPEHRAVIKPYFPAARFAKIPGAGHWLHAEKPREFEAAVRAFLDA